MSLPKISIITPSLNQGEFIERTIQSVLSQGYPNLEYFIFDGGSSDNTVSVIERYQDKLTGWVSASDDGQVAAINTGLDRISGDIWAFINADDYYLPGAFELVAKEYLRDPFDLIVGACVHVDRDEKRLRSVRFTGNRLEDLLNLDLYELSYITQPEIFMSKRVFEVCGKFNPEYKIAFDYAYWLKAASYGFNFRSIDKEIACFRTHSNQKTGSRARMYLETVRVAHANISQSKSMLSKKDARLIQLGLYRTMWRAFQSWFRAALFR